MLTRSVCTALIVSVLGIGSSVSAQGLGEVGFRAGAGLGLSVSDTDDLVLQDNGLPVPIAVGPAYRMDLSIVRFEADLLYRQETAVVASRAAEVAVHRLSLPLLLEVGIPGVSFLGAGIGIEPRILLAADGEGQAGELMERLVWYAPVVANGRLDLGGFALDLELRFEVQLSNHYIGRLADDTRDHHLMLFLGGFF